MNVILMTTTALLLCLATLVLAASPPRPLGARATDVVRNQATRSPVDCDFDSDVAPMCGWRKVKKRKRGGWKLARRIRKTSLRDTTSADGKFAHFRSRGRSQPSALATAVMRSKFFIIPIHQPDVCLSFDSAVGNPHRQHHEAQRRPSSSTLSQLRVYVVPKGEKMSRVNQVWTSEQLSVTGDFQHVTIKLNRRSLTSRHKNKFRVYLEAAKEQSSKSYVAIDGIKLRHCGQDDLPRNEQTLLTSNAVRESQQEESSFLASVSNKLGSMMLPAQRTPSLTSQMESSRGHSTRTKINPAIAARQQFALTTLLKQQYIQQQRPQLERRVACGLLEYTTRLGSCLRTFFVDIAEIPDQCSSLYDTFEKCVQHSAIMCVPEGQMSEHEVNRTVTVTLREKFNTKQVYCEEQGAFVYPEFSFRQLPQCGANYFARVAGCSQDFRASFQNDRGLDLCTEYYKANECQRHVTSEECTLTVRDMLLFGLQLQYQFAHNPFCPEIPVSVWWPANDDTSATRWT